MSLNKVGISVAAIVAVGALGLGGAALAYADPVSSMSSTSPGTSTGSAQGEGQGRLGIPGGKGGSADTPVTGDELAKVTAAVKAKDSSVTVSRVQKDPDGSYDVFGTKGGAPVMFEVSSDLSKIAQNTMGPTGGHAGAQDGSARPSAVGSNA